MCVLELNSLNECRFGCKLLQISSRNELKPLIQILNVRKLPSACHCHYCVLMHFLIGSQFNLSYKASSRRGKEESKDFSFFLLSQLPFKTEYIGYIQHWQDHALRCICIYHNYGSIHFVSFISRIIFNYFRQYSAKENIHHFLFDLFNSSIGSMKWYYWL